MTSAPYGLLAQGFDRLGLACPWTFWAVVLVEATKIDGPLSQLGNGRLGHPENVFGSVVANHDDGTISTDRLTLYHFDELLTAAPTSLARTTSGRPAKNP